MCASDIDADVDSVLEGTRSLWLQLWKCAADQASELTSLTASGREAVHEMSTSLTPQHQSPTSRRPDQRFHDCIEHTLEVSNSYHLTHFLIKIRYGGNGASLTRSDMTILLTIIFRFVSLFGMLL